MAVNKLPLFLQWFYARREYSIDLIRIYLGLGLFIRGALYAMSSGRTVLVEQINALGAPWAIPYMLVHYIILAHLVGGLMLIAGLLTRVAALVQVPVLAGAVFLVHARGDLLSPGEGFEFTAMVLFLLLIIVLCGPGRLSMDYSMFGTRREGRTYYATEEAVEKLAHTTDKKPVLQPDDPSVIH